MSIFHRRSRKIDFQGVQNCKNDENRKNDDFFGQNIFHRKSNFTIKIGFGHDPVRLLWAPWDIYTRIPGRIFKKLIIPVYGMALWYEIFGEKIDQKIVIFRGFSSFLQFCTPWKSVKMTKNRKNDDFLVKIFFTENRILLLRLALAWPSKVTMGPMGHIHPNTRPYFQKVDNPSIWYGPVVRNFWPKKIDQKIVIFGGHGGQKVAFFHEKWSECDLNGL